MYSQYHSRLHVLQHDAQRKMRYVSSKCERPHCEHCPPCQPRQTMSGHLSGAQGTQQRCKGAQVWGAGGCTERGLSADTWRGERNRKGVCQTDGRRDGGTLGAFVRLVAGRDASRHCVWKQELWTDSMMVRNKPQRR